LYLLFNAKILLYIVLGSTYETMSISTGLYPNLDLWNANKLQLQLPIAFPWQQWLHEHTSDVILTLPVLSFFLMRVSY